MSRFSYVAVDPSGAEFHGSLEVNDQSEALKRVKEMGLFPTRIRAAVKGGPRQLMLPRKAGKGRRLSWRPRLGGGVKSGALAVYTRQLATLVEAGMPLLRALRLLEEQQPNSRLKQASADLARTIEEGGSLAEALQTHPKIFDPLYVHMVKAGEISGALELTLRRLAEFMEKAKKLKAKVKAAMYYPCAVLTVASGILLLLMTFVVPRFQAVFQDLTQGPLPTFTRFVFRLSESIRTHLFLGICATAATAALVFASLQTRAGRIWFDRLKLTLPVFGALFKKAAIARFSRTLGTLIGSGVPILQALTIVKETAGNVIVGKVIAQVHENVKQGEAIAPTLKQSGIFPAMIAGMVDVGEQTGALPELLGKIADNCDEEVDNAANALTSLLEPIMIVILAVIVGSIVIAIFLPIIHVDPGHPGPGVD